MIPYVVMDRLEVPLVRARLDIDSNHGVPEQVRALTVPSVKAADRRSQRQVKESALLVQGEVKRPGIDTQASLPAITFPGVMTNGSWLRHRTEFPELGARAGVESPRITDSSVSSWRRVRADHDDISINARHRIIRNAE